MKEKLRKDLLEARKNLKKEDFQVLSSKVIKNFIDSKYLENSSNIMTYISFKNEVDTIGLIDYLLGVEKNVFVPVTFKEDKKIKVSRLKSLSELAPGVYNILAPKIEYLRYIDPASLEIVITPGLAFDRKGNRLGFGGGYYDRFFKNLGKDTLKIGFCYNFQLVEDLPTEYYDIPMDIIITEREIIDCNLYRSN